MTAWWAWLVGAMVLAALEVVLPGFVFLGFAAGAAVTGLILALGLGVGIGGTLLMFAVASGLAEWSASEPQVRSLQEYHREHQLRLEV